MKTVLGDLMSNLCSVGERCMGKGGLVVGSVLGAG